MDKEAKAKKTNAEHTADLQVMQMMVVMVMGSADAAAAADLPAFQTIRQVSVCEEVRGEVCVSSCANY